MVGNVTVIHTLCLMAVFTHYVTPTVFLYLAAAGVSRFWHRNMWVVYLAMAVAAALMPLH